MSNERLPFKDKINKVLYKKEADSIYAYALENDDGSDNDSYDSEISYEEKGIGQLEFESDGSGYTWLKHIEVDADFRRKGVASKMLELAIKNCDLTHIACVKENDSYNLSLTPEGESFIAGCLRKNVITPEMCIFSGQSPFILNEGSDDPGLDSTRVRTAIKNFKEKPKPITIPEMFKNKKPGDESDEDKDKPSSFKVTFYIPGGPTNS